MHAEWTRLTPAAVQLAGYAVSATRCKIHDSERRPDRPLLLLQVHDTSSRIGAERLPGLRAEDLELCYRRAARFLPGRAYLRGSRQ